MRAIEKARRLVAGVLLIWVAACATAGEWTELAVAPRETKQTLHVGDARVWIDGGTMHRFRAVWVGPDSLGGWLREPAGAERSFALDEVAQVEVRGSSSHTQAGGIRAADKVGALLAVIVVGAILAGAMVATMDIGF